MKFISFDEVGSTTEYLRKNPKLEEFEAVVLKKKKNEEGKREEQGKSNGEAALFSFMVENRMELEEKIMIFAIYTAYKIISFNIGESSGNGNTEKLKYKWPNAIYYEERKICTVTYEKIRKRIIVGIEINVNNNDFSKNNEDEVSLLEITGMEHDINKIIREVVSFFRKEISNINKKWEDILVFMNERSYLRGKKIRIYRNGKYLEKDYKFSRINRNGKISLIGKGDKEEVKFSDLKFKIF